MAIGGVNFLQMQHLCQVFLSLWGLRHSYVAIIKLHGYEETTKKLAEWSDKVADELYKTRTTQSAGCLTTLLSLLASLTLSFAAWRLPQWARLSVSPAMLVIVLLSRRYIRNYWTPGGEKTGATRVPLPNMEDYNEAERKTEDLLSVLEYLEYSWVLTSLLSGLFKR